MEMKTFDFEVFKKEQQSASKRWDPIGLGWCPSSVGERVFGRKRCMEN